MPSHIIQYSPEYPTADAFWDMDRWAPEACEYLTSYLGDLVDFSVIEEVLSSTLWYRAHQHKK